MVSKSSHKPVGDNARILSRYFLPIIRWRGINLTHPLRTPTESENMSSSFATPLALHALYSFCNFVERHLVFPKRECQGRRQVIGVCGKNVMDNFTLNDIWGA